MSSRHRDILQSSTLLLHEMDLERVLPLLSLCLDKQDRELIMDNETKSGKVNQLLVCVLPRKGPKAFEHFVRVLEQIHPRLAEPVLREADMEPLQITG